MFIELTPVQNADSSIDAVTINFNDVRSFYYDENINCTILRFFDESRTNFKVKESEQLIQQALANLGAFCSAQNLLEANSAIPDAS